MDSIVGHQILSLCSIEKWRISAVQRRF